ncbi:MAG: sigma-70 family RNA polymerase sigma factor [Pseudomonadota bacterium]
MGEALHKKTSQKTLGLAQVESVRIESLYKTYASQLSATLRKMYGNGPPDPDDISQQAFQQVIEKAEIHKIRNLKAFIWRTAQNLVFNGRRASETRCKYDFELENIFFPIKQDDLSPDRVIIAKQQIEKINQALERMSDKRRKAFVLHRVSGLNVSQVARHLKISRSTADEHINKAAADLALLFDEDWNT